MTAPSAAGLSWPFRLWPGPACRYRDRSDIAWCAARGSHTDRWRVPRREAHQPRCCKVHRPLRSVSSRRARPQSRPPCAEPSSAGLASVISAKGQTSLSSLVLALWPTVRKTQAQSQLTYLCALSLQSNFEKTTSPREKLEVSRNAANPDRETNGLAPKEIPTKSIKGQSN